MMKVKDLKNGNECLIVKDVFLEMDIEIELDDASLERMQKFVDTTQIVIPNEIDSAEKLLVFLANNYQYGRGENQYFIV